MKPGPRSAAELATIVPLRTQPRIRPPHKLTPAQARVWAAAVDSLPADYFTPTDVPQLVAYVEHAALAESLRAALAELDPTSSEFSRVSNAAAMNARTALAYARALRLVLNARTGPEGAGTAARRGRSAPATLAQLQQRYAEESDDEDSAG